MKRSKMTIRRRAGMTGRMFVLPFYIGFAAFFLFPALESFRFAFSTVTSEVGGFNVDFIGLKNFRILFTQNPDYVRRLVNSVLNMLYQVPLILVSAFFLALLLNQKFRGRTFARAVFFLPVIVASGAVMSIISGDAFAGNVMSGQIGEQIGSSVSSKGLADFFYELGMGAELVEYFSSIAQNIYGLLWRTGIQMLIFLSALQTISPSLYEASSIEGATAWENFWMITFPMILPMMYVNLVYTVVDSFTDSGNLVMYVIMRNTQDLKLGMASAMGWLYFLIIALILGIITIFFNKAQKNNGKAIL